MQDVGLGDDLRLGEQERGPGRTGERGTFLASPSKFQIKLRFFHHICLIPYVEILRVDLK